MPTFEQFIAAGVDLAFYGVIDDAGYLNGGSLAAPAAGNPDGSPMLRLRGVINTDPTVPEPEIVNIPGDNGTQGSFIFGSDASPAFTLEKSVFDLALQALAQGTLVFEDGTVKMGVLQPEAPNHPDLCWVLQSPSKKKDVGQNGLKAWTGYIIPLTQAFPLGRGAFNTRAGASDRMRIAVSPAAQNFDGMQLDETNFGTASAPIIHFTSDYPIYFHRFTGNGVEDTFMLAHKPASANEVRVRVNGTLLMLTTHYTVNLTTKEITFVTPPANGAKIVVRAGTA